MVLRRSGESGPARVAATARAGLLPGVALVPRAAPIGGLRTAGGRPGAAPPGHYRRGQAGCRMLRLVAGRIGKSST
ncbi:hypothetical protein Q5H92_07310 [Hymenobacter sp. M29]|uniref:Uncharacterized protein n=1 Tax=Hymenobacter mellowenesis TaxID=3063995 RepID=A0ABT9AAY9_9BACT|nr:hypothetical protein [Hymenobacter sp. M29]MDO7846156.1 hypothetical protein [Hymenobacter sp. M29]